MMNNFICNYLLIVLKVYANLPYIKVKKWKSPYVSCLQELVDLGVG